MEVPLLDLRSEYLQIREEVLDGIDGALQGMQLNLGPNVQAFEGEFAALCGTEHALGVSNGTDALLFCLKAAGIGPGDEVITTPWTFFATLEAIVHAGATPVVVDIEPASFCISPQAAQAAVTARTAAIIAVHIFGHPAPMDELGAICKRHGLRLVEDAAQAHGAEYHGRRCGSLGDCAAFSFYPTKNLGGYGEGGMVTTGDAEIARQVGLLRNHGHVSRFEHSIVGYNGRLDELQAAILRVKLRRLEQYNEGRRRAAARYDELLADLPVTLPQTAPDCVHCYHLYAIRAPRRDELAAYLQEHGVACQTHYRAPGHLQPAMVKWGLDRVELPNVMQAAGETLQLPLHPLLDDAQIEYVCETVRRFYG